jgi:hypothetical protein
MASKFGRDASGMGGGASATVADVEDGLVAGIGGGVSVDLFIANESAEGLGGGGSARVADSLPVILDPGLAGSGGRDGS